METLTEVQKKTILYAYIDLKGTFNAMVGGNPWDVNTNALNSTIKELEENFDFIHEDKIKNG